ncbi:MULTISPECIES: MFS transporter [unclassified Cryobacterium]|uniref:MFS transporter n=1 Tax=unclassified Cryobacterium TaxID=2649013 RepID=UPI002AB3B214|nr:MULTISPECIES: MFS transporter [unclassified Cryobacterium]MDY7544153.1 MFS transporter [Cryobacterium sp. 5B3]MEB0000439.1 MFS transporter [Cryobacterium sp. RTS3]MEB0266929.1 MFS transporter [Cryobacterium sp. 10I5]MEB0276159.1 MFS transporter [Cryobacterium sp. 5B3]
MTGQRRQRLLIALVQVLAMSAWFSASAVVPALSLDWNISAVDAVWLTASVQLGFVVGAVVSAVLNAADRIPPQLLMAGCALGTSGCILAFTATATDLATALLPRFLTGALLAGVYPVGMKLTASWAPPRARGRAFGLMIAALTLGSALPHLIRGLPDLAWRDVMNVSAVLSAVAAVVAALLIRVGPHGASSSSPINPRYAMDMFRDRRSRLANFGYFGHMWELFALWTWLPAFVRAGRSMAGEPAAAWDTLVIFLVIGVAGAAGALLGGWAADRYGRGPAGAGALIVSGSCALASPVFFAAAPLVLVIALTVWGASVIADSGVFSTSLSESADPRYVGTALTVQTAIGFLITVITIQIVPVLAGLVGWQFALLVLVPGPVLGAAAMIRLARSVRADRQGATNPAAPRD